MEKIYFKCTLSTDIVLNASLATEGNMQTLDYISGSNFLGIVASSIYGNSPDWETCYKFFHSDEVSFGDALIAKDGFQSYAMPFSLFVDKLNPSVTKDAVYVHHLLNKKNRPTEEENKENYLQLKQNRSGFFNANADFFGQVKQTFAMKSAQDRNTRRSKDGAMFGFRSIRAGQSFIFSVIFKNKEHEAIIQKALVGARRIGKSRSAQYGRVNIERINSPTVFESRNSDATQLIVYAESNLCFFNDFGYSTFRPNLQEFGLENNGKINWAASQIRIRAYSPWNTHRNTSSTQRDCLQKGSVLVIDLDKPINVADLPTQVGGYRAEGLGRVLYNPDFLQGDELAIWQTQLTPYEEPKQEVKNTASTSLGQLLKDKKDKEQNELKMGKAIVKFIKENKSDFKLISSSQWGGIRAKAMKAMDMDDLEKALFGKEGVDKKDNRGFLMNGVAAEKYWDKKKGPRREILKKAMLENRNLGKGFLAKLATEFAKISQQEKNKVK